MLDSGAEQPPVEHRSCQNCAKSMLPSDLQRPFCYQCAKLRLDSRYEYTAILANVNPMAGLPVIAESPPKDDLWTGKVEVSNESACNQHAGYQKLSLELAHMFAGTDDVTQVEIEAGQVGSNLSNKNALYSRSETCSTSSMTNLDDMRSARDLRHASQLDVCNLALSKEQEWDPELCQLQPGESGPSVDLPQFFGLSEVFGEVAATYSLFPPLHARDLESNISSLPYRAHGRLHDHLLFRHRGDTSSNGIATDTRSSGPSIFSAAVDIQSNSDCTSSHGLAGRSEIWDDVSSTSSIVSTPQVGRSFPRLLNDLSTHSKNSKLGANEEPSKRVSNRIHADHHLNVHLKLLKIGSDLDEHDPYLVDVLASDTPEFIAFNHFSSNDEASAQMTWHNFERYRQNISTPTLPKSIRNAIEMTRILGFIYLWVDVLCIVQDETQDYETHIMRMEWIYAYAFAVLVPLEKASSQSAWFRRPYTLQQASFSSRIIEIPQDISLESTIKDSPRARIQSFLDSRDDPWTPLKSNILSELRQSRTPEMKISFKMIVNASAQRSGKPPSIGCPNPNNPSTDEDMFTFLFPSDSVSSEPQLLETNFVSSNATGNGFCLQLMLPELPTMGAVDGLSGKIEDIADLAEFKPIKRSGPSGSRSLSGTGKRKKAENPHQNGACLRCFVMRKRCDMNYPCGSCVASKGKTSWWELPCRRCWLESSRFVSVPSWSWVFHRYEIMNSKINNRMSIHTLRRHMEMVYGIVASDYKWEEQISRWRIRHPLTLRNVTQILRIIKITRTLLQHRIFEAARATAAAPTYFKPVEDLCEEIWKGVGSHESNLAKLKDLLNSKPRAGLLDRELQPNEASRSTPTDTNNESGSGSRDGLGDNLDHATHGAARHDPKGSRRGLGSHNAGREKRGRQNVGNRPHWSNLVPGPHRRRLFRCPEDAAGLTVNHTSQCYKTAGKVQRIKDYHLKEHHHWNNNKRWLPRVHGDTDEDRWNRLFLKANPHWVDEHPEEPLPSPYHEISDVKDYVLRYAAHYPERLWPPDGGATADNVVALMAQSGSNTDAAVTVIPIQADFIQHGGRYGNAMPLSVAPRESLDIPHQEPELRPTITLEGTRAFASTNDTNMTDQPVPHDGLSFAEELEADKETHLEQLSTVFDPAYDSQTLPPLPSTSGKSMDGGGDDTTLLGQYTITSSNTSTYPESALFSPQSVAGSNTELTSSLAESTRNLKNSKNDKLCFCEDTFDELDHHFYCREIEQCLCEHCRGWRLWSDRGKDILNRAVKGEITLTIPERPSRRN